MQTPLAPLQPVHGAARRPGFIGWLLIAPLIAWLVAFVVIPALILLVYSFCQRDELGELVFSFSSENYWRVFGYLHDESGAFAWDPTYLQIFGRSLGCAGLTTILCVLIGYPVAWTLGRAPDSRRNLLVTLVMIPFWTSFLIRTYAWIIILSENGLLNGFLQYSRLISEPFPMLYTPGAVIVGLVYSYLPFMILPIYGSVEKLDNSIVEAALDLGAGPLQTFLNVILPLTRPGVLAGILLVFIPAMGMFAISDLMGGKRVPMIGNVIQDQFSGQARNWPFGSALGMSVVVLFSIAFWLGTRRQPES
ncbi:MAG: potB2 [Chthoniobacteraceae bacterium]|nr:potB2 [Chthoniobacteraceae bacterium]